MATINFKYFFSSFSFNTTILQHITPDPEALFNNIRAKMVPTLPFDVITIIMLMLPAEALVKLQCVCTSLRDLIRDPTFIKKHLQISASKGNRRYLLHKKLQDNGHRAFRLLFDKMFDHALDIEIPLHIMPNNFIIVGSFNGLLCLADTNCFAPTIYICNPSIRKYRAITFPITDFTIGSSFSKIDVNVALGFGYHDKNDDYKIVRIVTLPVEVAATKTDNGDVVFETSNITKVEVYSLVENSWAAVEADSFQWELFDARSDVVVNESIHWKAIYEDTDEDVLVILAFHLGEYVFRQLSVPNYLCDGEDLMEYVGVYKGNLSLFVFHLADQNPWDEKCYLWVMKEYGEEASWTKVHSVTISPGVVVPHTFTHNDEIVYDNGQDETVVYHFDTNTTKVLMRGDDQALYGLVTYMDSLVMISG